mmetsp:Transcript_9984/g.20965  ORF Transcript_9984/g.20965 Transcript_9984/m.20965 type:complete len:202 (-) Transcript_9984:144-749(-)
MSSRLEATAVIHSWLIWSFPQDAKSLCDHEEFSFRALALEWCVKRAWVRRQVPNQQAEIQFGPLRLVRVGFPYIPWTSTSEALRAHLHEETRVAPQQNQHQVLHCRHSLSTVRFLLPQLDSSKARAEISRLPSHAAAPVDSMLLHTAPLESFFFSQPAVQCTTRVSPFAPRPYSHHHAHQSHNHPALFHHISPRSQPSPSL